MFRKLRVKFTPNTCTSLELYPDEVICLAFFFAIVFLSNTWFVFLFPVLAFAPARTVGRQGKKKKEKTLVVLIYEIGFPRIKKKMRLRFKQRLKMAYA